MIWFISWAIFISDEPKDHKCISKKEIHYVNTHRAQFVKKEKTPYFQILITPAVWTVIFCEFAASWGFTTILVDGPTFIDKVLHKDIQETGIYNAAPHLTSLMMGFVLGSLSDWLLTKGHLDIGQASKLFDFCGLGIPGIAISIMGFFTKDFVLCITILIVGFGFSTGTFSGHNKSVFHLSPNFAGKPK